MNPKKNIPETNMQKQEIKDITNPYSNAILVCSTILALLLNLMISVWVIKNDYTFIFSDRFTVISEYLGTIL